jgi:hypothetical protein
MLIEEPLEVVACGNLTYNWVASIATRLSFELGADQ